MKMFRSLVLVVFCGIVVSSCFDPPEYPDTPEITFKSLEYKKGGLQSNGLRAADSVIVILNFKDGDGDVGVSSDELYPPFNDRWYFLKDHANNEFPGDNGHYGDDCRSYGGLCWFLPTTDKGVIATELPKFIGLDDYGTPPYDTLKSFSKPYDCINWQVISYDDDDNTQTPEVAVDTLYFMLNPHYNNIFVDFEVKNDNPSDPSKPFDKFDELDFFSFPNCGVRIWNGRIPILSEDLNSTTPLEGTIRYSIPSLFFTALFGSQTLRLRVRIEDRSFHSSNEIVTREFTLTE
jgi:hypothetical protein